MLQNHTKNTAWYLIIFLSFIFRDWLLNGSMGYGSHCNITFDDWRQHWYILQDDVIILNDDPNMDKHVAVLLTCLPTFCLRFDTFWIPYKLLMLCHWRCVCGLPWWQKRELPHWKYLIGHIQWHKESSCRVLTGRKSVLLSSISCRSIHHVSTYIYVTVKPLI